MNIDEIIATHQQLDAELRIALSTMERKDDIKEIRKKIQANQESCPHYSNKYNFICEDNKCPYCGKTLA